MKIATMTYQRHDNYGAMLQCYALQKKIEQMGAESEVIDYICDVSEHPFGLRALKSKGVKRYITGCIGAITRLPRAKRFAEFRQMLHMSGTVDEKNISQLGAAYDGYIVGSDNVWNADITGLDERYFLSFVADKRKRTSFAASFGSSKIRDGHRDKYAKLLGDFAVLTSREQSGVNLIENLTGKPAETVCDPSLLLTTEEWRTLAKDPGEKEPYLLAYQMVPSGSFVKYVKAVAKQKGLKVVYIPFPYGVLKCKMKLSIGPLEWLGLFQNAEYILTDSFHGCAFSVIFKKQFAVRISQLGERIEHLLSVLNIKNRVVQTAEETCRLPEIDYTAVEPLMQDFRAKSEEKLKSILAHFEKLSENGIDDPSGCTGCLVCQTVCKSGAIGTQTDELGFVYPRIDASVCVDCGACASICASVPKQRKVDVQKYYAAIHEEPTVVQNSGSGGAFTALATAFLQRGGVVYGAAYQTGFAVAHEEAKNQTGLERLRGTKYVQSTIRDVYASVAAHLKDRVPVLFVGTPCQCAAVKAYLLKEKVDDALLYVCDLFCHGVFSPKIWEEYIHHLEEKFKAPVVYVSFRDKKKGWRNKHLKIVTETQDVSDYCNREASVLRIYEQNLSLRESCYRCSYMDLNRCGDISIGDFWGIERVMPKLDKNTGVSAVIVNTGKGEELFDTIRQVMSVTEFCREDILQQVLREPTKKHSRRTAFVDDYQQGGTGLILSKYGQVKGKLYLKRDVIVPLLYKLRIAGFASRVLHRND